MAHNPDTNDSRKLPTLGVGDVVAIISDQWQRPDTPILDIGQRLIAARDHYGARSKTWRQIRNRLPFSAGVTGRLIAIGSLPARLSGQPDCLHRLPAASGSLYEISRLDDRQIIRGIKAGLVNPASTRAEILIYRATCQADPSGPTRGDPSAPSEAQIVGRSRELLSVHIDRSGTSPAIVNLLVSGINKLIDAIPGVHVRMAKSEPASQPAPEPASQPAPEPDSQPVPETDPVELSSLMDGMYRANHGRSKNDRWVPSAAEARLGTVYEDTEEPGEE